jgi:hypothetical protein
MHAAGVRIDGLCVLHRCDNPSCCNPAHLFVGTKADNVRDMDQKGRRRTWAGPAHRTLSDDDVRAIRASADGAVSLARRYGVGRESIWRLRTGKSWKGLV